MSPEFDKVMDVSTRSIEEKVSPLIETNFKTSILIHPEMKLNKFFSKS